MTYKKSLVLTLIYITILSTLTSQEFEILGKGLKYGISKTHSKVVFSNLDHNFIFDLKTAELDTIFPGSRVFIFSGDDQHLRLKTNRGQGIINWEGDIIVSPKHSRIFNNSDDKGFWAGNQKEVYLISSKNYKEIKLDLSVGNISAYFIDSLILVTDDNQKRGGSILLNIQGDTIANYLGKYHLTPIAKFPKLLSYCDTSVWTPGTGIMTADGKILLPFDKKSKFRGIGEYLKLSYKGQPEFFINQDGKITEKPKFNLKSEYKRYKVLSHCEEGNEKAMTLKKGDQVIIPCAEFEISILRDAEIISLWEADKGRYAYTSLEGETMIDCRKYKYCDHLDKSYFLVSEDKTTYKIVNTQTDQLFPITGNLFYKRRQVSIVHHDDQDYFLIWQKRKFKFYTSSGDFIFEKENRKNEATYREKYLFFRTGTSMTGGTKYNILDFEGNAVSDYTNVEAKLFKDPRIRHFVSIKKDDSSLFSLIDLRDLSVVVDGYQTIRFIGEGYVLLKTEENNFKILNLGY